MVDRPENHFDTLRTRLNQGLSEFNDEQWLSHSNFRNNVVLTNQEAIEYINSSRRGFRVGIFIIICGLLYATKEEYWVFKLATLGPVSACFFLYYSYRLIVNLIAKARVNFFTWLVLACSLLLVILSGVFYQQIAMSFIKETVFAVISSTFYLIGALFIFKSEDYHRQHIKFLSPKEKMQIMFEYRLSNALNNHEKCQFFPQPVLDAIKNSDRIVNKRPRLVRNSFFDRVGIQWLSRYYIENWYKPGFDNQIVEKIQQYQRGENNIQPIPPQPQLRVSLASTAHPAVLEPEAKAEEKTTLLQDDGLDTIPTHDPGMIASSSYTP